MISHYSQQIFTALINACKHNVCEGHAACMTDELFVMQCNTTKLQRRKAA